MPETKTLRSWREILRGACGTPQQKKALAEQIGQLTVRTIDRWISGESNPQKVEVIRKLAYISEEMQEALQREFPEAFLPNRAVPPFEQVKLPSEFYRSVVQACAVEPASKRRWTVWHLVVNQIIPHLDPERQGFVVFYTSVRSAQIQFELGAGNLFWGVRQIDSEEQRRDPWLVRAMEPGSPFFVNACTSLQVPESLLNREKVRSIGYFPLFRAGVAGGGLLLCSTQEDFFSTLRQTLIEQYADLLALMLPDGAFRPE